MKFVKSLMSKFKRKLSNDQSDHYASSSINNGVINPFSHQDSGQVEEEDSASSASRIVIDLTGDSDNAMELPSNDHQLALRLQAAYDAEIPSQTGCIPKSL
jgi:hypothetical protein